MVATSVILATVWWVTSRKTICLSDLALATICLEVDGIRDVEDRHFKTTTPPLNSNKYVDCVVYYDNSWVDDLCLKDGCQNMHTLNHITYFQALRH